MDNNLPPLNELHVFAAVADLKSFTGAARQLGSSTAAVSRVVRRLERRLGGRLLHRTTRSVGLTDLGESLHRRATVYRGNDAAAHIFEHSNRDVLIDRVVFGDKDAGIEMGPLGARGTPRKERRDMPFARSRCDRRQTVE